MDWFVRAFLKGSLVWFSAAVLLAVAMALVPSLTVYRTAHLHLALLGFVTQMIYGVATLASGFALRVWGLPVAALLIAVGGTLSAVGAACFVVNIWRTIDASPMSAIHARARSGLPTLPQPDAH